MSALVCSFCGRSDAGRKLVAGKDGAYICDSCVRSAAGILGWRVVSDTPSPLTRRQAEMYAFLAEHIKARNFAPSHEEIAQRFGYGSLATVHEHLGNLERKGWIRRRFNERRAIELLAGGAP